ncbi:MAG: phage portal protein [Oscillospiraceae bacterium]|nr:phage portal protein [Oscillospiraceae bacterium]
MKGGDNIKNPFKKKRSQSPVECFFLGGNETILPGYTRLSDNEEIKRCVYKIADLTSNMTIMLMENGKNGDIRLKNELSKKIDINPNKNMTRKSFIHKIVTDMCMTGNSVVLPSFSGDYIDNLIPLNGCSFVSKGDTYAIRHGTEINPDDVLHFVLNPHETQYFQGVGLAPLVYNTIRNVAQANATKTGFLQSKWKPSLIISINSDNEELQDKDKRKKILDSYTETTEAGEPWLIPAGDMSIEKIQPLTLNDLAIQDSLTLDLKTIACAIGIPPFMLGIGEFNKDQYNNFISTTIMSIATVIQQELTKKLLYSPNMYFKFNPKSLMQYDIKDKVQFVKEMVSGGMLSRNEGRTEFDYSPADDPGMNDFIVLENYIPVSDVGNQKKLKGGDGSG